MVEAYDVALVAAGVAITVAVLGPRLLEEKPLSLPVLYVVAGYLLFSLPHGVAPPDPIDDAILTERVSELVVIVALMGAGLKIDLPFSWRRWTTTWRLLGVTMVLTIGSAIALGHLVLGMHIATAVLLGAVLAPTDPVLASDVEAREPLAEVEERPHEDQQDVELIGESESGETPTSTDQSQESSVRFALTSEAGLNDGLAFPFTYLAILLAGAEGASALEVAGEWLGFYVVYKILVGIVVGYLLGRVGAYIVFRLPASSSIDDALAGAEALAGTLIIYGVAELLEGYGFIAVFVGALTLRHFEWKHDYHRILNDYAVMIERLLMAVVMLLFGGALAGGLLAPLTPLAVAVGVVVLVVVRPLAGLLGLVGSDLTWPARAVVAAFGIRGIGSFFYLSYGLNEATFQEFELVVAAELLWALVGFIVLGSVLVHGVTASPVMRAVERWEERSATPEVTDD